MAEYQTEYNGEGRKSSGGGVLQQGVHKPSRSQPSTNVDHLRKPLGVLIRLDLELR